MFREASAKVLRHLRKFAAQAEGWWFDTTRGVQTSGWVDLKGLTLMGEAKNCFEYLPSRAANGRRALLQVPTGDLREFTFVDFGSGKGRMLFVAAEFPFRRIEGVEFAAELHRQAGENIRRYGNRRRACAPIESLNINAVDYRFPNGKMVLYFFNPFGPEVMKTVLSNLDASLDREPREVFLVLVFPELAPLVRSSSRLRPVEENRRFCIYRAADLA